MLKQILLFTAIGTRAIQFPSIIRIYNTRSWKIFGEGPAQEEKLSQQGFNEGKGKPFTHEDIRFAMKGNVLYANAMGWPPERKLVIKSLAQSSPYFPNEIQKVAWVPTGQSLTFGRTGDGLVSDTSGKYCK